MSGVVAPGPETSRETRVVAGPVHGREVLDQRVGDVDPEPVHAPREPRPQHVLEHRADVGALPVEVRLLDRELVEVPLARPAVGLGDALPRRAAEHADPRRRRLGAVRPRPSRNTNRARAGDPGGEAEGLREPRVGARGVVRHEVDEHPQPVLVRLLDEGDGLVDRPERRVDAGVVGHVVAAVGHRRRVPGRDPQGVDTELAQVREAAADPRDVADPVAVARPRSCGCRPGTRPRAATSRRDHRPSHHALAAGRVP